MPHPGFRNLSLKFFLSVILSISCISNLSAAQSIRIAVLDFEANNSSKYAANAVSEFISTEMAKKGELTILERKQIGAILKEQGFQQMGCTEQECAVEMGKLLSAKKILLGTLSKTGNVMIITVKSVDVETGKIDFAESEKCMKEDDLELASKILAVKLVNNIAGTNYTIPMRTYKQDESRNKFAVGMSYKFGIIKDVNVPAVKSGASSLKIISSKADIQEQSILFCPSYEFTDNFGIRMDFKVMHDKFKTNTYSTDYYDYSGNEYNFFDIDAFKTFKGYGLGLNLLIIYPIEGFNLFLIPGIGIDKYKLISDSILYAYNNLSINYEESGNCKLEHDIYTYLFKFETGVSVYVSRYVELYFSAGIDFHLFSKFISDIKIKKQSETSYGSVPSDKMNWLENADIEFKGNFPPEYYVQAGIVLRLF